MIKIIALTFIFAFILYIISIINAWMQVNNLRKTPRFGTGRMVFVNKIRIHFIEFGDGPPLVMLPGILGNYRTWNPLLPVLSNEFRCLAIDFPGIGASDKPADFEYNLKQIANLIIDLLDELKIEIAHFMGLSYGGSLVYYLAAQFPLRVGRGLTLEGWADFDPANSLHESRILRALTTPVVAQVLHFIITSGQLSHLLAKRAYGDRWKQLTSREKQNAQHDLALAMHYLERLPTVKLLENWIENDQLPELVPFIETPVLQLIGTKSINFEAQAASIERLKLVSTITQWIIEGGGQHLHWQHPRWIGELTIRFFKEQNIFEENNSGGLWELQVTS